MTAQIIHVADLAAVQSGGPRAGQALEEEMVTAAAMESVKDGVRKHAECRHGSSRGLGDHDKTRGVMTHDGEDDDDAEQ